MSTTCTVDMRVFNEAMRVILAVPGRFGAEVVNSAVMKVIIGTGSGPGIVQMAPKATEQKIRQDLTNGSIPNLADRLARKTARKHGITSEKEIKKLTKKIIDARVRSRAFIAASWLVCARKMRRYVKGNLQRLGGDTKVRDQGDAASSFVVPAGGNRLSAAAFSTAEGAKVVTPDGLIQSAVDNAARDMIIYIDRKFGAGIADAINNGHSANSVLP